MMADLQLFPVWKRYDKEKGKWKKIPAIPKGVDWHDYSPKPGEIERAENIGIVIPDRVVVLDLDTYKGVTTAEVDQALGVSLDWEMGELQRTVTGGVHYGFSLPAGVTIRQGDNLLGVKGFDTRTTGNGWICSGEGYEDLTLIGLRETMRPENLPELPAEAVEKLQHGTVARKDGNELSDLEDIIGAQPLEGLTLEDMRNYLKKVPESELNSYQPWVNIGMACHHQTAGSKDGLRLWVEASKRSEHYDAEEIKAKWPTFGRRGGTNQVTFAYVIMLAGGRDAISNDLVEDLLLKASKVEDMKAYDAFKKEVLSVDPVLLGPDLRAMIASEIAIGFGKSAGMTKTEIKQALTPSKRKHVSTDTEAPDWVDEWVYVEMLCEFANTALGYAIKREAFNAKFDRMPDCVVAERSASSLALNEYKMPTVVDKMFWPGAEMIFDHEGKTMLNAYREQGVLPCGVIDDDGQEVVDLFMSHLYMLIEGDKERRMLIDWMAYVVQNPGKRVNWALLLQGAQGIGKTYFVNVLQMVLGSLVTNLDPTAINGRFTGWAHGSLVVAVEEIRISGTNRFETLDRMKPFITNPTVQIEEKGRDHRTVPNFTSYFLLTNHKDAIPLTAGDRRYGVIFSRIQTEEQLYEELGGQKAAGDYFNRLFGESERRADALARWLYDYEISADFDAKGRAPETDARRMMMDVSISPERSSVEDALAAYECDVVTEAFVDITWLNEIATSEGFDLPKTRAISAILLEMGYEQIDGRRVKVGNKNHYVWVKANLCKDTDVKKIVRDYHNAR